MTENQLQYSCISYMHKCALDGVIYYHVPNEAKRPIAGKVHMWKMGLLPGVPDLEFIKRGRVHYIELKVGNRKLTAKQADFRYRAESQKIPYAVCKDLDAFISTVKGWGLVKGSEDV